MHLKPVGSDVIEANRKTANTNREIFLRNSVYAVDLMSAPGAGKTSVLERTIERMKPDFNVGVIEGDLVTRFDADRIAALDVPSYQITTGAVCHLDAQMIHDAIDHFDISSIEVLFIENIGNMVCPAEFELGEDLKVMVYSTVSGAEKPKKYPLMFQVADAVILNKADLIPFSGVSLDELTDNVREVNPYAPIFPVSCRTGEGIEAWTEWLTTRLTEERNERRISKAAAA